MWPRYVELALACWLIASHFVLGSGFGPDMLSTSAVLCGVLVALFAILSFQENLRRAHLGSLVVGVWLTIVGYAASRAEVTAAAQNHVIVGLLLLMFALIPSEASLPPRSWRQRWES